MPDYTELQLPFFARPSTKRSVDELGHLPSLCIVAGSGVTVDRTGMSWKELVTHLLVTALIPPAVASELVEAYGVQQAASVAVQKYYEQKGPLGWSIAIANELRRSLYDKSEWLGGRITSEIAELWLEFANSGRAVSILTTNYDQNIELDIQRAATIWAQQIGQAAAPGGNADEPNASSPDPVSAVKHLHGIIPENGAVVDFPVISERDYFERSATTEAALAKEFVDKNVILVGSGLTDRPLLHALLQTRRDARAAGLKRYAIVPRSDLSATEATMGAATLLRNYDSRLQHFGLEGIFIDHYSQVAQLLAEVRIASTIEAGRYPDAPERHGQRLGNWWSKWFAQIDTPQKYSNVQEEHHEALVDCLAHIKSILDVKEEGLLIELWRRWQPSRESRRFRLWASSFSRFKDWRLAPEAEIRSNSGYMAVQSFCAGRPIYGQVNEINRRWKTFVAVPLEPKGEVNLVVGSIILLSMTPATDSAIGETRRGRHGEALAAVRTVGATLAGTETLGSLPQ